MMRPFALAPALLTLAARLACAPPAFAQGFSPEQRREIVEVLRNALKQDPTILRDALKALEQAEPPPRPRPSGRRSRRRRRRCSATRTTR